jgi:hypothetical protein
VNPFCCICCKGKSMACHRCRVRSLETDGMKPGSGFRGAVTIRPSCRHTFGRPGRDLAAVGQSDVVVLAVPSPDAGGAGTGQPHQGRPPAVDVCSVKERPIRWMQELLPEDVDILGTHPMFGPTTQARCKEKSYSAVRVGRSRTKRSALLASRGAVIETSPAERPADRRESDPHPHFIGTLPGRGVRRTSTPRVTSACCVRR